MRLADTARDGADTASSQPMLRSIRSLKIPYRELFENTVSRIRSDHREVVAATSGFGT
jgi:hypothetical protein